MCRPNRVVRCRIGQSGEAHDTGNRAQLRDGLVRGGAGDAADFLEDATDQNPAFSRSLAMSLIRDRMTS